MKLADEVEISNIGGESGVASEATLRKLVASMEKMARAQGSPTVGQAQKAQEAYKKSVKESTDDVKSNSDAFEDNTSAVRSATRALGSLAGGALSGLMAGIGAVTGSATGLATELVMGGDRLADFAQHVPLVGGVLASFAGMLDRSIDSLRAFSDVGISFNNSLEDMIKTQLNGSMSFETFQQSLMNNLPAINILGTSMSNGAKEFTRLTTSLRTGRLGQELLNMGFSMEGINDGMGQYVMSLARTGRLDRGNTDALIEGTSRYLKEVDALAKLTGMQREEAAALMAQQNTDAQLRAIEAEIAERGGNVEAFKAQTALLETLSPDLRAALVGLMDGIPDEGTFGAELDALTGGAARRIMESVRNQTASTEDFYNMIRTIPGHIEGLFNVEQLGGLKNVDGQMYDMVSSMGGLIAMQDKSLDEILAEQGARDGSTNALLQFRQSITRIRNEVLLPLVERFFPAFNRFMDNTFSDEQIQTYLNNFSTFMDEFKEDPKGKIIEIFTKAKDAMTDVMFGYTDENGQAVAGLFETLPTIIGDAFTAITTNETVVNGVRDAWAGLIRLMEDHFVNSALVRTVLGIEREDVGTRTLDTEGASALTDDDAGAENLATLAEQFAGGQRDYRQGMDLKMQEGLLSGILGTELANYFRQQAEANQGSFLRAVRTEGVEMMAEIGRIGDKIQEGTATEEERLMLGQALVALRDSGYFLPDEERSLGTLAATGRLVEPKTTYAKIHQGERVLNPEEASNYNNLTSAQSSATINQEGVISAINQLNITMAQAAAMLSSIERNSKRQITAFESSGSAVY